MDRPGRRTARGRRRPGPVAHQRELYWLTGTAGSSANSYYEAAHAGAWGASERSTVPTGVAVFPAGRVDPAHRRARTHVVHWSEFDRGGHFAAMEAPDLLVGDVREFFSKLR